METVDGCESDDLVENILILVEFPLDGFFRETLPGTDEVVYV